METKKCTHCDEIKSLSQFGVRNKKENKLHEWCRECLREYAKKYREKNPDLIKKKQKAWYNKKGKIWKKKYDKENLERTRERDKTRYHTDPNYRMKKILRSRLAKVLKGQKKSKQTLEYVGTDLEFLRKWIEFQFDDNMTWENQGTYWAIDHVIPCASFDLSNENHIHACFHWRNLRPMEGVENDEKGDKIDLELIKKHENIVIDFEHLCISSRFGNK